MRPAVYASVVRNRKQNAHRIRLRAPQFSIRRVMVMVCIGGALFIPGLTLTILGLENEAETDKYSPGHKVMYTVIGPAACALGVTVLLAALLYYFCYGLATTTHPRHTSNASGSSHHGHSSYSSVRSGHGHDSGSKSNGEARTHSRHSNRRSNSSGPHSQKQHHHKRPASVTQHTPEEGDQTIRLADQNDVTITLENTPIPTAEDSAPEVEIVQPETNK